MLRVVCDLPVDARIHAGCCDKVDATTGEVLKTAEELMKEACASHPNLRPCGLKTDMMNGGWAVKATCRKCQHLKRMWEENENPGGATPGRGKNGERIHNSRMEEP